MEVTCRLWTVYDTQNLHQQDESVQERPLKPEKTGQILTFRTKNPENEIPETDILDSYWDRLFIDQLQIGFPLIGSAAMCLQQWSSHKQVTWTF